MHCLLFRGVCHTTALDLYPSLHIPHKMGTKNLTSKHLFRIQIEHVRYDLDS